MFSKFTRAVSTNGVSVRRFANLSLDHKAVNNTIGTFRIQTYNKISPVGLAKYPEAKYVVADDAPSDNHAIMLRSYKLQEDEVPTQTRCIARCGAGTNNIPVERMTELGIPVFNTPGANANAVKELVICGLLLSSRKIVEGINHMSGLFKEGTAREKVEKDKAMFGGQELLGKTLGIVGLGNIGAATARDAAALGMSVVGYDPNMTIESALKLPKDIKLVDNMKGVFSTADYVSLNIPYIKKDQKEGGTHHIISRDLLMSMKKTTSLLNFARGELVDDEALKQWFDSGATGKYVTDFPTDVLGDHPNTIVLPHLGASTEEAEDQAATMASETIQNFLETGQIVNSVNFPETILDPRDGVTVRIAIVNENKSGVLAPILGVIAESSLNIVQQVNRSRGDIAYNVIDVEISDDVGAFKTWAELQESLTMCEGVISSRFIHDSPGSGYAKNVGGKYFV